MKKTFIRAFSVLACATFMLGACSSVKGKGDSNKFTFFSSYEEAKLLTFDNLEEIKEEDAEPILESLYKEVKSLNLKMDARGDFIEEGLKIQEKAEASVTFYQDNYYEVDTSFDVALFLLGTKIPSLYKGTSKEKGVMLSGNILSVEETTSQNDEHMQCDWEKESINISENDLRSYEMGEFLAEVLDGQPVGKFTNKTGEYWVLMDYDRDTISSYAYDGEQFKYQKEKVYQAVLEVKDNKLTRGQAFKQTKVDKNLNNGQWLDEPRVTETSFTTFEINYGELASSDNRNGFVASIPDFIIDTGNTYVTGYASGLGMNSNGVIASVDGTVEAEKKVETYWIDDSHVQLDVEFELANVSDAIGFRLELDSFFASFNANGSQYFDPHVDLLDKLAEALGEQYPVRTYLNVPYLVLPGESTKLSLSIVIPIGDIALENVVIKNAAVI